MLKLGHIRYSNCLPVHGRFVACGPPTGVELVTGEPSELNRRLSLGQIDVAPASSIEFARHADRYRLLPGLSISARSRVRTIRLLSRMPLDELDETAVVALPTASATSVTLVKIIMAQRLGIRPRYRWFDQARADPFETEAEAALYIGDVAFRHQGREGMWSHDLGELWHEWTGLPFVFALWQANTESRGEGELRRLAGLIHESRAWSAERLGWLAERFAEEFGWPVEDLRVYWERLDFGWSDELEAALLEFYRRAAELGEIEAIREPVFLEP